MHAPWISFRRDHAAPARIIICRDFNELVIVAFKIACSIRLPLRNYATVRAWWWYA